MGVPRGSAMPVGPLPTSPSAVPAVPAGPGVGAGLMERLGELILDLRGWPGALFQLGEADLGDFVAAMVGLSARAESLALVGTVEAVSRGVVASSTAADPAGWVAAQVSEQAGLMVSDPVVVR
ncbi:MAG: hypothetical protein ABI384_01740, partial [Allobranchiibius sp.]